MKRTALVFFMVALAAQANPVGRRVFLLGCGLSLAEVLHAAPTPGPLDPRVHGLQILGEKLIEKALAEKWSDRYEDADKTLRFPMQAALWAEIQKQIRNAPRDWVKVAVQVPIAGRTEKVFTTLRVDVAGSWRNERSVTAIELLDWRIE